MKIELIKADHTVIAEIISEEKVINSYQDALDLMANCQYQGTNKIILDEKNIVDEFFDLKNRYRWRNTSKIFELQVPTGNYWRLLEIPKQKPQGFYI